MFWSKEKRDLEHKLEAMRIKEEQAEKEDARQIQGFEDRAWEAKKKNDFPAMKAIVEEARKKGFGSRGLNDWIEDHEREMQKQKDEEEIRRDPLQAINTQLARGNSHKAIEIAASKGLKEYEIAIRQQRLKDAVAEGWHSDAAIHAARLGELTGNPYYQVAERSSRTAEVAEAKATIKRLEEELAARQSSDSG